jgi:UDP-glucose 4-epimerase
MADTNLHWWRCDLAEVAGVQRVLHKIRPDVIFHLAGEVVGSRSADCVMPTFRSNLMSTINLLTVAGEIGSPRVVLSGSLEEPRPEEREAIPCSPYAAAKWASSAYARMFCALYQLPVVIVRIFMVYGPAQRDLKKLIPYVIFSLLRGEAPKLSSGTRLVDWIYVEDVMEGLLMAGQSHSTNGSTIDIGSGQLVPIRTVVEFLVNTVNPRINPLFGAIPDRSFEQIRKADVAKSKASMGWTPTTSLQEGLRRTVDWYKSHFDDLQRDLIPSQAASGLQ